MLTSVLGSVVAKTRDKMMASTLGSMPKEEPPRMLSSMMGTKLNLILDRILKPVLY